MKLYSATATFKHTRKGTNFISQYEERTVIVKAKDFKEAEKAILQDFEDYSFGETSLLKNYDIQELDETLKDGVVEVASFIRVTDQVKKDYLKAFKSDLRPKSCKDNNWKHEWYTKDQTKYACYNCQKTKTKKV